MTPLLPCTRAAHLSGVLLAAVLLIGPPATAAVPRTVCTVTINSPDEKASLQKHLPAGDYRFVELVQRGRPDWLAQACRSGVVCDTLVISGHFDDGTEFYTDRFDQQEHLSLHALQQASCSASCAGVFAQLKDVYLFGCNTLKPAPRQQAAGEVLRSLARTGPAPADAERRAALLNQRYGQSNRDRLRQVFTQVPVLYGFSSKAPLGRSAGPLMDRYLQTAPAGEVGSGRRSATLLALFGPASMVAETGLGTDEPQAALRQDLCSLAADTQSDADKLAFVHGFVQRDAVEARLFVDDLEHHLGTIGPTAWALPAVAAQAAAIAGDSAARQRFLSLARDTDDADVQTRLMALARTLGWLNHPQQRDEFVQLLARHMARGRLTAAEVDLSCTAPVAQPSAHAPPLATALRARGAVRTGDASHAAALACLGDGPAHQQMLLALTSGREGDRGAQGGHDSRDGSDSALAQIVLRHRPIRDAGELHALATAIGRMAPGSAQVRALDTLARLQPGDRQSLQHISGLFGQAQTLQAQRAIAGILLRADRVLLPRDELLRTLRLHRLRSPDGPDVIDALLRRLQAA